MRLPSRFEAALWLLLLIGCSASPMNPSTNELSHAWQEALDDDFFRELLSLPAEQPIPTVGDPAASVPSSGSLGVHQPQQLGSGATWSEHGPSPTSLSYNGRNDERSSTGLLDDIVASYVGSGSAGHQRQGSASYSAMTADRSGGYPHASRPQGDVQRGYPYVGGPTVEYQVRPNQPLVRDPASYVQLGYRQRPSSSAQVQQPTLQHDSGHEQGPPILQSTGHASLRQPYHSLQRGQGFPALLEAIVALGRLLDQEPTKELVKLNTVKYPTGKKGSDATMFHSSEEVKEEVRKVLQQKLNALFPGRKGDVIRVGPTNEEYLITKAIRKPQGKILKNEVAKSLHADGPSDEPRCVEEAGKSRKLISSFQAGQWLVMLKRINCGVWAGDHVGVRVSAFPSSGQPTLYIDDYLVPGYTTRTPRIKRPSVPPNPALGPGTSDGPSGVPSGQPGRKRGRPRRGTRGR